MGRPAKRSRSRWDGVYATGGFIALVDAEGDALAQGDHDRVHPVERHLLADDGENPFFGVFDARRAVVVRGDVAGSDDAEEAPARSRDDGVGDAWVLDAQLLDGLRHMCRALDARGHVAKGEQPDRRPED